MIQLRKSGNTYRFPMDIALWLWYGSLENTDGAIRLLAAYRVKDTFGGV